MVFDGVKIEEPGCRYSLLSEDLLTSTALKIIWKEPGGADGNDSRCSRDLGVDVLA